MGEIHVHEFMSLDGVIEAPSWTMEFGFDPAMGEAIGAITGRSAGILLGRRTFEMFGPAWSERSADDDPGVPFFNDTPKYVVSGSLTDASSWQNSEVLGAYDPAAIQALKDRVDGDLYVSGSSVLVRGLLADGLIDGLHLFVFPTTRGAGDRLFGADAPPATLALEHQDRYANGVLYLHYRPAG